MTQIILNVENPDIIPSLRKVLGQINGVTISKTKKIVDTEKKSILKSIETGYKQVKGAEARVADQGISTSRCTSSGS